MTRKSKDNYFKTEKDAFAPLSAIAYRKARFEEVDPLSIVWHGRYASYFEDGRTEFGNKYNLSYNEMFENKFLAPIVQFHVDHHKPLLFENEFKITALLHWSGAARLNFSYKIERNEELIATGFTVQMFLDMDHNPLLFKPRLVEDLYSRWESLL